MIKDLLVPLTNAQGDASAVAAAVLIANRNGAHLSLLEFVNMPMLPTGPWGGGEVGLGDLYTKLREDAEADAAAWRERLSREDPSLSCEVRIVDSLSDEAPRQAALHAHYVDLTVMAMASSHARDESIVSDFFASLLLDSGRPLLLIPPGYTWTPATHIVVAWQPKREATRALHDAMPFLHDAATIDVLEVGGDGSGALPGADIAAHLARHGLRVEVAMRQGKDASEASALVAHARESGAGLIVAGGYGHSRMREWVMGGVTRELLIGACPVPILFSH